MIRVAVVGAGGRMGRHVVAAVGGDVGLSLAAAVDPSFTPEHGAPAHLPAGTPAIAAVGDLPDGAADVVVDFTVAPAAEQCLRWCADHQVHAVVGTTGLDPAVLDELGARFAATGTGLVVAANFAIGAVLLMRLAERAAPFMDGVEIIELHHDAKRDAPSGTAIATAERVADARRRSGSGPWPPDPTDRHVLEGSRGASGPGDIHVHAVRLPGLTAHQEVIFGAMGQSLTLRHDAFDRTSFMPGVLLAIHEVARHPGLTVGIDTLLGF